MTREELEHAIRAASEVAGDDHLFVFGSQAILGQFPEAPATLRQSVEADISPVNAIDRVDEIDGLLGELSQFHEAFGFYVHGVSIETPVLPEGWRERAIAVCNKNTNYKTGWCLEAHDLAVSKLIAFREKDRGFVRVLLVEKLVDPQILVARLNLLPVGHPQVVPQHLQAIRTWISGVVRDMHE